MRRNHGSFRNSGVFTSPGTPEHGQENAGEMPKGWSSERLPLPGTRRPVTAAALMPFNGGRTLPSKWDDAERWITSPISGYGGFRIPVVQPQRRPKSKSGPLGPSGLVYYSPTLLGHEGSKSPLTTGVLVTNYQDTVDSLYVGNNITRSTSVPGMSDLLSEASAISDQDEVLDMAKEEGGMVLCRDVATQMSPEGSSHRSSSGQRLSFSVPAVVSVSPSDKDEVRDVQVDRGTMTASKRQELPSAWEVTQHASTNISKVHREESKITAWENLQKAKAEAAIRKLEMKLEKRRSGSMERISRKLRGAEMKAEAMRNSLSSSSGQIHSRRRCFIPRCCLCTNPFS